ncbi:restriction endonuclease subunit S [Flavobacterium galactosidilyticum]|uniref:restriction endonuclease subunit S n=1 Tax=Flavobacterium galactosidilyticum TaxID=2893886 RepID=UPI001E5D4C0C|nr:restriction endonuclease subunit S [Flavobacterium sp. F-340]UFH45610.1 restriction endonuclease subunit S [Flavobacterium sp. F-340]
MATIQNIPKLRFPGFKGEWEKIKLGKLAEKIGDGLHGTPIYSDDSDICFINGNNLTNGKIEITDKTKKVDYAIFKKNDKSLNENTILISLNGTIGNIAKYNNEKVMLGKSVGYFNFKESTNFYFHVFHTDKIQNFFISELTGSTIKNLSLKTLRGTIFPFPSPLEQQKIASFLSAVDEKIQQLSRKKELVEQYKKGVMQQLFSGKLRFKDENGTDYADWESVKMNELFSFKQGIQCGIEDQFLEKSDNMERFIRIIDLTSDKEIPRFIKNTDKGNLIFEDDLFMVRYGVPGLIGYGYNGVIANNLFRLIPKKSVHNKFYLYVLTHLKKDIMNLSSSTTMPALNFSSLGVLKIPEIEIEEQQKIATFLSSIDVKIESTKQEIHQMQSFKKGLLQQMFV